MWNYDAAAVVTLVDLALNCWSLTPQPIAGHRGQEAQDHVIMMPSPLSGPVPNAGSPAGEATAKKPSVLLTLHAEPSAAPARR